MRALEPEVVDAIWAAFEPLLPTPIDSHPLGCHRPRVDDRLCFRGVLIRLVTGASWVDIEAILDHQVSDTTLRARRDEWIAAGVFDQVLTEANAAFDRVIGLDLSEVALDGSLHKAPYGGEGTGPNPTDRAKLGWKWSVAVERHGIPIGWAIDGANRNDVRMLAPTIEAVASVGLLADIETLHLDRGYDYPAGARRGGSHRPHRSEHPTAGHQRAGQEAARAARTALDRRSHQLVVVELRPAPTQHRPPQQAPPRRAVPRHDRPHRRQTPHPPRPLESKLSAYPLRS